MEFRTDVAVGHFASIAFTKHGDIVGVNEVLDVGLRHYFGYRLMLEVHCIRKGKSWVALHSFNYLEIIHFQSKSNKLDD